jgi:hypothetical protein
MVSVVDAAHITTKDKILEIFTGSKEHSLIPRAFSLLDGPGRLVSKLLSRSGRGYRIQHEFHFASDWWLGATDLIKSAGIPLHSSSKPGFDPHGQVSTLAPTRSKR